ncbi:MAG: 5-oxoprolinase subunit PxpA [Gammaproteobacteria bacterium]|nr:5-oxoprolinase subunit PxpA [Gammaproteobacteria bacterium]
MTKGLSIDINCDLGEGSNKEDCEKDALLMPYISSCNIACGAHAGNPLTIRESLKNAQANDLKIGAHPGYADKDNFGRQSMDLSYRKLETVLLSQMYCFTDIAEAENIEVQHIKFHGALYNDIEKNQQLSVNIANIVMHFFPTMKVVGLAGGKLQQSCNRLGLSFLSEGFIDRSYLSNGRLTPRSQIGALLSDHNSCINQAIALASNEKFETNDDNQITRKVDTLCLHGDNPDAYDLIKIINTVFEQAGITIQ